MHATKQFLFESSLPQNKADTNNLISILDSYANKINILSLDCFDTILGRHAAQPIDVFYYLQQQSIYRTHHITADIRQKAENSARKLHQVKTQFQEVTLAQIYAQINPEFTNKQIDQFVEAEFQAEMLHTFAIQPVVELILAAKERNLKIIVVSDTYFEEQKLRRLLNHHLPKEANEAISTIICSCMHGYSKSQGLFGYMMHKFGMFPQSILHIGDNVQADYVAPRLHNLHAVHFNRNQDAITTHTRLHAIAAGILDPRIRISKPLINPFSKHYSKLAKTIEKPESIIGYLSLGPIMLTFASYIAKEVEKIKRKNKNTKMVFLLRDAHLPARACEALIGSEVGLQIRLSRFTSNAASFLHQDDIDQYIATHISSNRFDVIMRQLLLPEKIISPILQVIKHSQYPTREFITQMQRVDIREIILAKSSKFRERLIRYLEKEINLQNGDHLVLIDLGYYGTAQRKLIKILADKHITVSGRYLISLAMPDNTIDSKGLLDLASYDSNLLHTLVNFIALLEQLCTVQENSVIDYSDEGDPIYEKEGFTSNQYLKVSAIQAECIKFIHDTKTQLSINDSKLQEHLTDYTLHELGRMLFYPTQIELDYLQCLRFDTNLGSKDTHDLFDIDKGLQGLRRRGMFYLEKHAKVIRTNFPIELRSAGFELVTTLLTQYRYNLDIKLPDLLLRHITVDATLRRGTEVYATQYEATSTHDGYYALWAPVGKCDIQLNLHVGKKIKCIQIDSAELIEMQAFASQIEVDCVQNALEHLSFTNMNQCSEKLYVCTDESSTIKLQPTVNLSPTDYIFRLVFRPIINE